MYRRSKHRLLAAALASSLVLAATRAPADSLVTTDGDMMIGAVAKTASGYTIQTADGPVTLPTEKVKRVLYDHPPAALAPQASPSPAAAGTAVAPNPRKLKMLNALLDQGRTAMAAAEFTNARDAFKDALTVDPKNAVAGRGLGFAYIALGSPARALAPLEIAALVSSSDRPMVLAISSALVANHNPMRAVKYLKPYLETHSRPVDETMLNALGTALSQADASAAKGTLFKDSVKLYLKLNTALEATHSGQRRWGTEWEESADVASKEAERAKVQKKVDAASAKLQSASSQLQAAQSALSDAENSLGKRQDAQIHNAQDKVNQLTQARSTAQSEYNAAEQELAAAPKAEFPTLIAVANSDLATFDSANPAGGTDFNAVASAAPAHSSADSKSPGSADSAQPQTAAATAPPEPAVPKHLTRYAVAFAIAPDVLVTAFSVIDDATSITIQSADGKSMTASVLRAHQGDGLALLKVDGANFPCLLLADAMGEGAISCMSFPDVDLFNPLPKRMTVAAGPPADSWTVHFEAPPRLPGGPLIQSGAVVGVELGDRDSDPTAVPAATLKMLQSLVADSAHGGSLTVDPKLAVVQVMAER